MNLRARIVLAAVIAIGACGKGRPDGGKGQPDDGKGSLYLAGDSIDRLIESCKTGRIVQACHEASARSLTGEGTAKDVVGGVELAARACELGDLEACEIAGGHLWAGNDGVKADAVRAAPLLVKACAGGRAAPCEALGDMFRTGEGVAADPARSLRYYEQACDGGDALGCFNAHVTHHKQGDEAGALAYLKRACALGDTSSCDHVAKRTGAAAR